MLDSDVSASGWSEVVVDRAILPAVVADLNTQVPGQLDHVIRLTVSWNVEEHAFHGQLAPVAPADIRKTMSRSHLNQLFGPRVQCRFQHAERLLAGVQQLLRVHLRLLFLAPTCPVRPPYARRVLAV